MLERCFVRLETLERIQSCWLGPAITQYGKWLCECGYRVKTLATRVSILRQFGTFAQAHGAQRYEELLEHLEPFVQFWIPATSSTAGIRTAVAGVASCTYCD